jgi:hypothetical protein
LVSSVAHGQREQEHVAAASSMRLDRAEQLVRTPGQDSFGATRARPDRAAGLQSGEVSASRVGSVPDLDRPLASSDAPAFFDPVQGRERVKQF